MALFPTRAPRLALLAMPGFLVAALGASGAAPQARVSNRVQSHTYRYSNTRLGWNSREQILSPANVRPETFGKKWSRGLDGFVDGAPLLLSGLTVNGQKRDVVVAATDRNSVWALDARSGQVLWERKQLAPAVTEAEFNGGWGPMMVGIRSTPVYDPSTSTVYACGIRSRGLRQEFVVWALDARSGKARAGWPQMVRGRDRGATFAAGELMQRGALLLQDGWVYIPFGSRGDIPPWRGWAVAFDTRSPNKAPRAFCTSPRTDGAGLWNTSGLSADGSGAIFAVAGNGQNDLARGGDNLGQTVMRLRSKNNQIGFSKRSSDYFLPSNYRTLDVRDEGLGSSAAIVLPAQPGTSTPHLLFTGGKDGFVYLLNRDNLGGVDGQVHKLALFNKPTPAYHEGIRSTPAYFDAGARGRLLLVPADEEGPHGQKGMVALRLEPKTPNGPMRVKIAWSLKRTLERPTSPIVSSRGDQNGIVWLVEWRGDGEDEPSALRAFDALSGRDLYTSDAGVPGDRLMGARRFSGPVVANGSVFVGARGVSCYGLVSRPLPAPTASPTPIATPPSTSTNSGASATLTPTPTPAPLSSIEGTIVSVRGNILVVKPILRLSRTRVAFSSKTEVTSYRRADRSILKIGQRVDVGGPVVVGRPWSLDFVVAAPRPIASFEKKGEAIETSPDGGWRGGKARVASLKPFAVRDDAGKVWRPSLASLRRVWSLEAGGRDTLLIGTKIFAQGIQAPDGVIAATNISPDRSRSQSGTMFGAIASTGVANTSSASGVSKYFALRPRFTQDRHVVRLASDARLMRQVSLAPASIKVGDAVTVWGEKRRARRSRPLSEAQKKELKAFALLVGPLRFPASREADAPKYFSGRILSLNPPQIRLDDKAGTTLRILPTAQMPIARLEKIATSEMKQNRGGMFVLSRGKQDEFVASTVILDAAPWVGYGQ